MSGNEAKANVNASFDSKSRAGRPRKVFRAKNSDLAFARSHVHYQPPRQQKLKRDLQNTTTDQQLGSGCLPNLLNRSEDSGLPSAHGQQSKSYNMMQMPLRQSVAPASNPYDDLSPGPGINPRNSRWHSRTPGKQRPQPQSKPFEGRHFDNIMTALNLDRKTTLHDALQKSFDESRRLHAAINLQLNRDYLSKLKLPPIPSPRGRLVVTNTPNNITVSKIVANTSHHVVTNGGYSRTNFGGFYIH
jgi:hypothetical protein